MPRDTAPDSAHSAAGHQLAQAPGGAAPIGRVETVAGTVTAQHPDGTVETLTQGASVYQRDLIATQAGAKVALVFADKTTFALGESGQMRLDEMVYDPSHKDGKIALSMLKGAFAFVSGDIASTQADAMTVRTPVGTIGIRGTAVEGNVASDGSSTFSAVPDPSGAHSTIAFTNGAGTTIVTENFTISVSNFFTAPGTPFASPGGGLGELGALMAIAGAIASTINPGGSTPPEGAAGPTTPQPGQAPQGIGDPTPLIHVSVSETYLSTGPEFVVTFDYQPLTPQYVPPPIPTYLTVPPSPPQDTEQTTQAVGFLGTLGVDHFVGTPAAELFNFAFVHNSLQSGDYVDGGGGNDTLTALFDKPFAIDSTLTIKNVPNIEVTLGGGASTLDALNITVGPLDTMSTITVAGNGALTVSDLQVNLDGHAMTGALVATAIGSGISIEGGAAANTLTGAGYGHGDVLSYQHAASAVVVNFAAGTAMHGGVTDSITGFDGVRGSAFDDNINVSLAGGGHSITVEGGAGNNTLTGSLSDTDFLSYVHAPAGASVDFTAGTASNGYGGTDVFSGFSGAIGSAFDDSFVTTDTTHTIIGGGGNDTVSVDGTINNLTLINIKDVIGINPGATGTDITLGAPPSGFVVDLTGGGGNDTVAVLGGNGGSISVGSGDDAIAVVGNSNTITAGVGGAGLNDVLNVAGSSNTISVDPTGGGIGNVATVGVIGDSNTVTVGNGSDLISVTMTAVGSSNAITVGNGDDLISVTGNSNTIHFGTGSDTIGVAGDDNVLIDGAPLVRDVITIAGNADQLFLSGGKNHITISGADDLISITGGDDSISVGGGSVTVDFTTLGNDPISFTGSGASAVLNFQGFADDVISMSGSGDSATINGGNATVTINDSGAGNAVSALSDDLITVNMSGTNSSLSLNVNNDANSIVLNGTAGTSELIAISGNGDSSLIAASGDDTISVGGGSDQLFIGVTSNSGPHSDLITLSGANDQLFVGSDDTVSASLSGPSDLINVFGDDAIVTMTASGLSSTVDLIVGDDDLISVQGNNATVTVSVAGAIGDDTLMAAGNSDVISVVGGSSDTFFVDASGTGDTFVLSAPNDTLQAGELGNENFLVNATALDDSIVVAGNNDTITAILGGTGDSVVINGQDDFLSLTGNFETFTIDIAGGNATTHASGDTIDIGGSGGGSHDMITVDDSFSVGIQLYGSDDLVSISTGDDAVNVSGNADTVSFGFGCHNAITLFGNNDTLTVTGSAPIAISITGSADTVTVDVTSHSVSVSGLAGDIFSVVGNSDFIEVVGGSGFAINATTAGDDSFDSVFIQNGDDAIAVSISMAGTDDSIDVAANDDTITATLGGADDVISVSGDNAALTVIVTGADDTITLSGADDVLTLPGNNETFMVNVNGCGDSIFLSGSGDTITLNLGGVNPLVTVSGHDDVLSVPGNFENFTVDVSGAADTILISGSDDTITVGGSGAADVSASGSSENVIVTALASSSIFSFGDPANSTLTLDVAGSTTETVDSSTGSFVLLATTTGAGVSDLILENGSYHLTFDGSELNGGNMMVDGSQLGAGSSLDLDVHAETSGSIDVRPGAGADNLTGNLNDTLDYSQSSQMVTLTLTNFASGIQGGASGTGAGGSAAGDQFTNFGGLDASTAAGGELIIGASASDTSITSITLGDSTIPGAIHEGGCSVSLSGFDSIANQSGIGLNINGSNNNVTIVGGNENDTITTGVGDDVITVGSGSNSISVGSGDDVITITGTGGGTNTITVGANTAVAFQNANDSTQNNLNILQNWSDNNERIDLSTLTAQASIVNQGTQANFVAAFGTDTAGELDYAVIGGNTYVHLASGAGYSTHDLLVEITGTHTLTVTSPGVVHH